MEAITIEYTLGWLGKKFPLIVVTTNQRTLYAFHSSWCQRWWGAQFLVHQYQNGTRNEKFFHMPIDLYLCHSSLDLLQTRMPGYNPQSYLFLNAKIEVNIYGFFFLIHVKIQWQRQRDYCLLFIVTTTLWILIEVTC